MVQQHTINIAGSVVRNPLVRLAEPVTLDFLAGEHIAIVGPNGGGKSLLVDMLTSKYPLREGELAYDFSPSATKTVYEDVYKRQLTCHASCEKCCSEKYCFEKSCFSLDSSKPSFILSSNPVLSVAFIIELFFSCAKDRTLQRD